MNKKNKNKNRSKPTNPTPLPEKTEPAQNTEETITVTAEETQVCLVKDSDCVIEIPSEVKTNEPDEVTKEMSTGTPKKPKRNKGKKKKQEEMSSDENKSISNQDSIPITVPLPPPLPESEEKVTSESVTTRIESNVEEENKSAEQNITANVRKKKNKKKQQEQTKLEENCDTDFVEKTKEESKKEEDLTDKALDQPTHETTESEIKQAKKKNKKKKHRIDSEKSDKAEEVVACTAAFKELISSTGTEGNINPETNKEIFQDSGKRDKDLSTSVEAESLKDLIQNVLVPDESKELPDVRLQQDQSTEPKSKKKSKKDKKQQQSKIDAEKNIPTIFQPSVVSTDIVQEIPSAEKEGLVEEPVPKVKAKIAKPVEKKRKGKTETSEGHEKKLIEERSSEFDIKETVIETEKMSEKISKISTLPDESRKNIDMAITESTIMFTESENTPQTLTSTDVLIPPSTTPNIESDLIIADVNIGIMSSEEILEPMKSDRDEKSEPSISFEVYEEKNKETAVSPEPYKIVEKKKKKHPKKIDVSEKLSENKVLVSPELESKVDKTNKQSEDSGLSAISPSTDDSVEIHSLKTDEPIASSDVTPDFIQHPLASSQQFVDDNNNIMIREITTTEDKLGIHLMIPTEPIIQGSGATPEPSEKIMPKDSPSISKPRERSVTNEPEKTDLKSKMMEVSQDMEELRLSIERSLAELTSMERTEEDVLKGSHDSAAPITIKDTPTEVKWNNSKDDITEKSKSLGENILEKTIEIEAYSSSDIFPPKTELKSQEETLTIPKDTQEQKIEIQACTTSVILSEKTESNTQEEKIPKPENILQQIIEATSKSEEQVLEEQSSPLPPARKDNKGKGKGKKKGKQEAQSQQTSRASETTTVATSENTSKEVKKEEKEQKEQKTQSSGSNDNKGKQQQAMQLEESCVGSEEAPANDSTSAVVDLSYEPIENFEDALTSSVDDVNKTFEMIANEVNNTPELTLSIQNPEINIISPTEETERAEPNQNPVSPPKNLLGHPDIPVPSNRTDYKKERNKPPNMRQAKVKIKDAVDIEKMETKQSKESQTENKRKIGSNKNVLESFSYMTNENAEYVYKYSFRKVFLQSLCHVCRKELGQRLPCQFCCLVFYCSQKHKEEDWPQHQALCFAICTIAHLKDQKHIYADAQNITGLSYRLLRMQMIISCEKVLKRKLLPWEQEALLYPRMCAGVGCREWRQSKLADCDGCGQLSYCSEHPSHLPPSHQRWCRSYALYQKLVHHQQTRGRLEPKLPAGRVGDGFSVPDKINEVLAAIYDEKIDMSDMEYAALTQLATAPLTAAYGHQLAVASHSNGITKKTTFTIHIVGAELQFEADVLFKWELFFLHLQPQVNDLRLVLVSPDLNPSRLPLHLLEKVKLCESCRADNRRVQFSFQDKKTYYEYWASDDFCPPDIVCAFNPSIQRSSMYNGKDLWPTAISCILKLKTPFIISAYSMEELNRDVFRVKECAEISGISFKTITEPKINPFASVRPDRNFITDDEIPLLFKNYCFVVLCGV